MFAFSRTSTGALAILQDVEECLAKQWSLSIKASSRALIVCKGDVTNCDTALWACDASLNVLGHHVQADAGIRAEWVRMKPMLWGVFWKNAGNQKISKHNF